MTNKKPLTLYERACKGEFDHILEKMYKKKYALTSTNTKEPKKPKFGVDNGVESCSMSTYRNTVTK